MGPWSVAEKGPPCFNDTMRSYLLLALLASPAWAVEVARIPRTGGRASPALLIAPLSSRTSGRTSSPLGSLTLGSSLPDFRAPAVRAPGTDLGAFSKDPLLPAAFAAAAPATALTPSVPSGEEAPGMAVANPTARPLEERLAPIAAQVEADLGNLSRQSPENAKAVADGHMRLVLGEPGADLPSFVENPASPLGNLTPAPLEAEKKAGVGRMIRGTMALKVGMEAMTTGIPFVALATLGGTTGVALLVVGAYGLAQALSGSWAGSLTNRFPAQRVLAFAVASLAASIGALAALSALNLAAPWVLYALYSVTGAAVGVAETSRRLIPPLILGQDQETLRRYNGRLHRFYEVAGVFGSALAGLVIWKLGASVALWITPPLAALAAFYFWRVRHDFTRAAPAVRAGGGLRAYWEDLKTGYRVVIKDPRTRWLAVAMVLPQIVHRVFENLILPIYAKQVLHHEALSAALLTSSNLGELIGATILLKYSARFKGPSAWVKWAAYGLLAVWALSIVSALGLGPAAALAILIPAIVISSMTWASSHLSLETDVQERMKTSDQPRAMSLLYGLFVIGAAVVATLLGQVFDHVSLGAGVAAVNAVLVLLAGLVWLASRRLA